MSTPSHLPDDAMMLAELERFATRTVAPRVARPEHPLPPAELAALLAAARDFGLVPGDEPGLALWDDADVGPTRSVDALIVLAGASASVALALHVEALAAIVARALGGPGLAPGVIAVEGRYGLGGRALARLACAAPLDDDDRATLTDVYGPGPRLVTAAPSFGWVAWPTVELVAGAARVGWRRLGPGAWRADRHEHAHGFDDLATVSIEPTGAGPGEVAPLAPTAARELLLRAIGLHALGLTAIAVGATTRGHARARAFAATRRQGGALIDRHAAVALLLASGRTALATIGGALATQARAAATAAQLPAICALRAEAHPLLCRAGNDALQVFGGLGYMRDVGLEKLVRDLNHLRALAGTPIELALIAAEWERLHG